MIHPSYTELIDVLSGQEGLDDSMLSRYTIIIAAAQRARQLVDGKKVLIDNVKIDKPVSIAVNELYNSKIKILSHNPDEKEAADASEQPHELSEISLDNYGNEE
ncbi:DNA-directed RNA polymerase subunit omega [Clostridiales bacterium]|nr:DNA-directed RNA polymerase subunit omega [Clostridiales bacterium]